MVTYGLIIVSVLTIAALLMVFTPLGGEITDAIGGIVDEYVDRTNVEGGSNNRDEVNRTENDNLIQTITLNFVYENGQEIIPTKKIECEYGEKINISTLMPAPEGYKPNYTPGEQTVTRDLDYTITYYPKQYAISYNLNGGTIVSSRPNMYIYGQGVNLPTKVMKEGYTFLGWYEDKACLNKKIATIAADRNEDITIYAKWSNTKYSVTYMSNNNNITSQTQGIKEVVYGQIYELPVLESTGPTTHFAGWYDNPAFTGASITHTPVYPDGDLVYYAKWTTTNGYLISYEKNGGEFSGSYPLSYTTGITTVLPRNIKRNGYTFAGWYDNVHLEGAKPITSISGHETGNKMFYAKWTPVYYTINYDLNGGTINGSITTLYTCGTEVSFPTGVTKTGHRFLGWKNVVTGESNVKKTTTSQFGNIYLVAEFEKITYPLNMDANGGKFEKYLFGTDATEDKLIYTKQLGYNEKYGDLFIPVRTGYKFTGWYTTKEGDVSVSENTIFAPTSNQGITIYAHWEPLKYTIKYVIDEQDETWETPPITEFTFGTAYNIPTNITKLYHTLEGWYTDSNLTTDSKIEEIPANQNSDITLFPKWTPNTYNITYILNGGSCDKVETYTYGETTSLPTPTKEGYVFDSWQYGEGDTAEKIISISDEMHGDIVLTAIWKAPSANILFTLCDKNNNPIIQDGKSLTYLKEGVNLYETYPIPENYITEYLEIDEIYYHDAVNVTIESESQLVDNTYEYNLIVEPYKRIYISSLVKNNPSVKMNIADKYYSFKQEDNIEIENILSSSNEGQFTFANRVSVNGPEQDCSDTNTLKEILKNKPASSDILYVKLWYNETAYNITFEDSIDVPKSLVSGLEEFPTTYFASQGLELLIQPTRACYVFTGWSLKDTTTYIETLPTNTKGDITLVMNWYQAEENDETHQYVTQSNPTCQSVGIDECKICGKIREVDAVTHDWDNSTVESFVGTGNGYIDEKDANGQIVGLLYRTDLSSSTYHRVACKYGCGNYKYIEHDFEMTINKVVDGDTETYSKTHHTQTCKTCKYTEVVEHTYNYTQADDGTKHIATCSKCKLKYAEEHMLTLTRPYEDRHIHACVICEQSWELPWDGTKTEEDVTYKTCSKCHGQYNPNIKETPTLTLLSTTIDSLTEYDGQEIKMVGYLSDISDGNIYYIIENTKTTTLFSRLPRYYHKCVNPNCENYNTIVQVSAIDDSTSFTCPGKMYTDENGTIVEKNCNTTCSVTEKLVLSTLAVNFNSSEDVNAIGKQQIQVTGTLEIGNFTDSNYSYTYRLVDATYTIIASEDENPEMIEIPNDN